MKKLSRRQTLKTAAIAALGLVPALGLASSAKAGTKLQKKSVQYQDKPKAGHQCDHCRHFVPPHSCKEVAGTISPKGWCMLWTPRA